MTHRQLIWHYGSEMNAARALKLHRQTVNKWKKKIPLDRQIDIELATGGKLTADLPPAVRSREPATGPAT